MAISGYIRLFPAILAISGHLAIMLYLKLLQAITSDRHQSLAIFCFLWLSLDVSGYLYQVSSKYHIRVQLEAGESKLLLFETFLFVFLLWGFLEELALLKTLKVLRIEGWIW